jgi:hypothetical protein
MKLYIQIQNGLPINHPAAESNLKQAFGNIPPDWEAFDRVEAPSIGVYEKNQTVSYLKMGDSWTDVFSCEQMTTEEITAKQNETKALWAEEGNYASWVFDVSTCSYYPPSPKPQDDNNYTWRESDTSWVYTPEKPQGDNWVFNLETGVWGQA